MDAHNYYKNYSLKPPNSIQQKWLPSIFSIILFIETSSFSELGDPFSSYVSKESCSFIFNTYPDHIQDVLALYKECLESPYFDRQLIEECGNIIELENQTFYLSNTFDTFIEDITHAAIYGIRSANGHKLRQDPTKLRSIAPQTLYEFYERNMSYKNLVYCASGVNHKEFVEAIQKNMPTLTSTALSEPTPDMLEMKGPGYIEEDRTKDKVHVGVSINTGSWRDPSMKKRIELKRIRCVCHHVITNTLRRRFLLLLGWSW